MRIIRCFDVNRCNLSNIKAHVIGCDLIYGKVMPCNKISHHGTKWVFGCLSPYTNSFLNFGNILFYVIY
nr:MAG TPA: hypothetical protein [Caudoviricetes sp.]